MLTDHKADHISGIREAPKEKEEGPQTLTFPPHSPSKNSGLLGSFGIRFSISTGDNSGGMAISSLLRTHSFPVRETRASLLQAVAFQRCTESSREVNIPTSRERLEEVCWNSAEIRRTLAAAGFDRIRAWDAAPFFKDNRLIRPGCRTVYLAGKPHCSAPGRTT